MSPRPIALSPDLLRLRNEGYDLEITANCLLVRDVPYVNSGRNVRRGTLISKLDLNGDITNKPTDHTAYWIGDHPCHRDGRKIESIQHPNGPQVLGDGLRADFMFSAKADYRDYHHKVTTYVGQLPARPPRSIQPRPLEPSPLSARGTVTACSNISTPATSRAGIGAISEKLSGQKIGIVGIGGSGTYILDLVAKTTVAEIHLFDADVFSQHNAFRSPGAPSLEELQAKPTKVAYFSARYSQMRHGVIPHDNFLDSKNAAVLDGLDFVFLCLDVGSAKRAIVDRLDANGQSYIEVGMGVLFTDDNQLAGNCARHYEHAQEFDQKPRRISRSPMATARRMSTRRTYRSPTSTP